MGTLGVSLTDAPACGFDAVNVTVSKVRVHQSSTAGDTDSGWSEIVLSPARKINLLNLTNGTLDALGQTSLSAGRYTQLRLVLDANTGNGLANSVVPSGGTAEVSLETPSAVQSGIKLTNEFDVAAGQRVDLVLDFDACKSEGQRVDLVLDFDACKSVVTRGNGKYALKPVVKVIPTTLNGISGYVATSLLGSRVMVRAQQNGAIISATVPNATTGEFALTRLPLGNYDVVVTADSRAAAVVGAVPVTSTSAMVPISQAAAPIGLPASLTGSIAGTVTLSPASATEAAYVAAKQTFAAGPVVTIKYQGADLASGAYTLAGLPLAAPLYAPYSATLPLAFASAATVLPGVEQPLSNLTSFSEQLQQRGYKPGSRWLKRAIVSASADEQMSLALSPNSKVARLERLRLADDVVMAYEVSVLPQSVVPRPEAIGDSLYEFLDASGKAPSRALQHIRAMNASGDQRGQRQHWHQGVNTVQHAAVARQQVAAVLGAGAAFQHGFKQVADHAEGADHDQDNDGQRPAAPGLQGHHE
eukprot:gene27367-30934_t